MTYEGDQVTIPTSKIARATVDNLTRKDKTFRIDFTIGISYDSDLALVKKTLKDVIDKLEWKSKAANSTVYLTGFGDSSVNYQIIVWIDDADNSLSAKDALLEAIWRALKHNDIAIAHPQLDVHLDHKGVDFAEE